jgi:X-Pro dipeptidyl-peptidase
VTLDIWIFRPDVGDTGEKVPIIVNYSPYWSNLAPPTSTGGDAYSLYLIDHFVPRGYAVALVSVRGTGLSEGCFTIGGPQEVDDVDKIATFLGELPWSNGDLAAVAKSYDGTVAQMLLTVENPHVKTIVPVSPISEWYKYNHFGGVTYSGSEGFNTIYEGTVSLQQTDDPSSGTYEKTPTRICEESADVQTSQYQSVVTGDYSPYWQERNYTAKLPDTVSASVFYVHGLADWNVKPDHMVPWIDELHARNVTIKMWLGQWGHDYPHRDDWNETLLAWFDSELKGIDTGIRSQPLVQVQDNEGTWRDENDWPPTRATPTAYYPTSDGALGGTPGTGTAMYGDAPEGILGVSPAAGSVVFESAPFEQEMRIAGTPFLTTTVSATSARATLAAALLVDGKVVDQGFLDLVHRDGLETSVPMVPGESYQVLVHFYPQDIVVPKGGVLSLYISSGTPKDAPVAITTLGAGGAVTLALDTTTLMLPMIRGGDVRIEAVQPEDLGCWTC